MNVLDLEQDNCTGCKACAFVCQQKAITFEKRELGFFYPTIDKNRCTGCGRCVAKCQISHKLKSKMVGECYSYVTASNSNLLTSSSGGAFFDIASNFIDNGGIVYGCSLDQGMRVSHVRVANKMDLELLKGSKYIQSDIGGIFSLMKKDFIDGKSILFSGTPCQVNAVKLIFNSYKNSLFTIDLICHGVPSNDFFLKYICFYEHKNDCKVVNYYFRKKYNQKTYSKCVFHESVETEEGKNVSPFFNSVYYTCFLKGVSYRESCYSCEYADTHRVGDISLGDFWGLSYFGSNGATSLGCSLVLINSNKGELLCKELHDIIKQDISLAIKHNEQLIHPSSKPILRNELVKNYEKEFKDIHIWWKRRFRSYRLISLMKYYCPGFIKRLKR